MSRTIPNNQIDLLQNGDAYFAAIEKAFEHAAQEVHLESYIFKADDAGRRIAGALRRAALRGVKTHVLIDGFGSQGLPSLSFGTISAIAAILKMNIYRRLDRRSMKSFLQVPTFCPG